MLYFLSCFILFLPLLPALVSADCAAACDSYNNGLRSCQTKNSVVAVGSPMDSNTIHCMCSAKSNLTDMDTCLACLEANPSTDTTSAILLAWTNTCKAELEFGDKQAALCWQNQPDNTIPCSSKSDGYGGASNVATGSASSQSQIAKSDAILSSQAAPGFLTLLIMSGVVIWS